MRRSPPSALAFSAPEAHDSTSHFFPLIVFPGAAGYLFALVSALIDSVQDATINRANSKTGEGPLCPFC